MSGLINILEKAKSNNKFEYYKWLLLLSLLIGLHLAWIVFFDLSIGNVAATEIWNLTLLTTVFFIYAVLSSLIVEMLFRLNKISSNGVNLFSIMVTIFYLTSYIYWDLKGV